MHYRQQTSAAQARLPLLRNDRLRAIVEVVVHTPNATLVASRDNEEQIRKLVKELESRGWGEYL